MIVSESVMIDLLYNARDIGKLEERIEEMRSMGRDTKDVEFRLKLIQEHQNKLLRNLYEDNNS